MSIYLGDAFLPYPASRMQQTLGQSILAIIDNEAEKLAIVTEAPRDGNIEYLAIGVEGIPTVPTADADFRVETVSASGEPTGTLWATNTNYAQDMSLVSAYQGYKVGPLTAKPTVTKGQPIVVVYVPPASPDTGDVRFTRYAGQVIGFPYSLEYTGGSWSKLATAAWNVGFYYDDGDFAIIPGSYFISNVAGVTWSSSSTYDHVGASYKPKIAMKVVGMWCANLDLDNVGTFKLIEGTNTVRRSVTLDPDVRVGTSFSLHYRYFAEYDLVADTQYRWVLEATTTGTISMNCLRSFCANETPTVNKIPDQLIGGGFFYDYAGCEGELSTPAWQDINTAQSSLPSIGPIVRRIG